MSHHTADPACPLCEEKLAQAHADLAEWYRSKVKAAYPNSHVSWSYRDQASQEQAVADGKSELHYPASAHNKTDAAGSPRALALDLFFIDQNGKAYWPAMLFAKIADDAEHAGDPILWGGHWRELGDSDHFQWELPPA